MCGFTGAISLEVPLAELGRLVTAACATIRHRGPDDEGLEQVTCGASSIALGFRRLSILDLSPAGHQPMRSATGRWSVAFNGEIYNFERLREELQDSGANLHWRGHSDTEVLLAALEAWGLDATLPKLIGMFAIAALDQQAGKLYLIRDRFGVKPLYWGHVAPRSLWFGSELRSIEQTPGFSRKIDRSAIASYMRHNYIPAPASVYEDARKVRPGHLLEIDTRNLDRSERLWYDASAVAMAARSDSFGGDGAEMLDSLDDLLRDAVSLRMVADVPLGVFLSGGIDSTLVTALMQAQSPVPVKTYAIGFRERHFDESPFAAAIAKHLGTEHTEFIVTPHDALDVVPEISRIWDEPFADSSQIPTYLLCRLAREHVTVCLSGDGGDEFFGGYNRYFWCDAIWSRTRRVPSAVRRASSRSLRALGPARAARVYSLVERVLPRNLRVARAADKIERLARVLEAASLRDMYLPLVSHWEDPGAVVIGGSEPGIPLDVLDPSTDILDPIERMMLLDSLTYLPDDILVKVDRASMAVSLEAREPLLDHRLFEFAWRIPTWGRVAGGEGKLPLRNVLGRYVPAEMFDRPKMGFGVPIDEWLRGPLRSWAEDLLSETVFQRWGLLHRVPVMQAWDDHLSGRRNRHYELWTVLMLHSWLERRRDAASEPFATCQGEG